MKKIVIALDAMGGDFAPEIVIKGANLALSNNSNLRFLIFGNNTIIENLVSKFPNVVNSSNLVHTTKSISASEKPSIALRNSKDSSMALAINAVKSKEAAALVSSGNTGALMALSKVALRTLPNISRPAIAGILPTVHGKSIMLDLGANAICDAENLLQFAIMGDAFAKIILKKQSPSVGLLNIGSEAEKGNEVVKSAGTMLNELKNGFNFYGYIEGNDISKGIVDVVVTDGFSGNIALKTAEGVADICKEFMSRAFNSSIISKIGYLFSKKSFKAASNHIDPRKYNGAMFLGLNGIIVKSHGATDEIGFCNAILVAASLAENDINAQIINELSNSGHLTQN